LHGPNDPLSALPVHQCHAGSGEVLSSRRILNQLLCRLAHSLNADGIAMTKVMDQGP